MVPATPSAHRSAARVLNLVRTGGNSIVYSYRRPTLAPPTSDVSLSLLTCVPALTCFEVTLEYTHIYNMERFSSRESVAENKEREPNKKAWGKLRSLVLAGSLLANGGFIGDRVRQAMRVDTLEKGGAQSFSVEFGGGSEDNLDPRGKWGERAEFSLRKGTGGQWLFVGNISAKNAPGNKSNDYTPLHTISYELPSSLTPAAAETIFNDMETCAKSDAIDLSAFEETLNKTIDMSEKGEVVYYNPHTGRPKEKFEFATDKEEVIQTNYFNDEVDIEGNPKILSQYPISLRVFQSDHDNPINNYEEPEQREWMWQK